jgi:type VI secretion system protein ImpH
MATAHRQQNLDIINKLVAHPQKFDFFQAVRLLLRSTKQPIEKAVQIKVSPSLQFPDSEIYSLKQSISEGKQSWEVIITFMGLTGSQGVLPTHYTELLLEQIREKNLGVRDFFDMLQKRSLNLFYQAWEKRHFYVGYEFAQNQPQNQLGQTDNFSQTLYSLGGLGIKSMRDWLPLASENLAFYSGFFANEIRTADSLESMLKNCFQTPIKIEEFQGKWLAIPPESYTRLLTGSEYSSCNNRLGIDSAAGTKVWNCSQKIRVKIGPLNRKQFNDFLPNGDNYAIAQKLIYSYLGMEFNFDLQLILAANQIKLLKLTKKTAPQLGWNSWLCSKPATEDKDDIILSSN